MLQRSRPAADSSEHACRLGVVGAVGTLAGVVLSGPLAVAFVSATHPQPSWQGPDVFAAHSHPVQSIPYAGGIILVSSLILLISALQELAPAGKRALPVAALVFCAAFAGLIFLNYAVQTTFVPAISSPYDPANAAVLSALTMSNPRSLAWAIEMWGWGLLGVATALVGGVFSGAGIERSARLTFVANAPVSIAGALLTTAMPGWMMTSWGLVAFSLWNVLLVVMVVLALLALRHRLGGFAEHAAGAMA